MVHIKFIKVIASLVILGFLVTPSAVLGSSGEDLNSNESLHAKQRRKLVRAEISRLENEIKVLQSAIKSNLIEKKTDEKVIPNSESYEIKVNRTAKNIRSHKKRLHAYRQILARLDKKYTKKSNGIEADGEYYGSGLDGEMLDGNSGSTLGGPDDGDESENHGAFDDGLSQGSMNSDGLPGGINSSYNGPGNNGGSYGESDDEGGAQGSSPSGDDDSDGGSPPSRPGKLL